jgi:hypothetical protein
MVDEIIRTYGDGLMGSGLAEEVAKTISRPVSEQKKGVSEKPVVGGGVREWLVKNRPLRMPMSKIAPIPGGRDSCYQEEGWEEAYWESDDDIPRRTLRGGGQDQRQVGSADSREFLFGGGY